MPAHRLEGHHAIAEAFHESMAHMQSFGYTPVNYFESEDGQCAAFEMAMHHVMQRGKKLNFPQLFLFGTLNKLITRLQASLAMRLGESALNPSLRNTPILGRYDQFITDDVLSKDHGQNSPRHLREARGIHGPHVEVVAWTSSLCP